MSANLPQTMNSPRFLGNGQITFGEKPVPTPGPGQLLLQVQANALCGSERGQFFHGTEVTPGHETAGCVVATGPSTHTPVGTPGIVFLMDYCGECRSCKAGFTNQCFAKRGDMGFNRDGGYGPYEIVHETIFFPVDADLTPSEATLLLDIMGTGGHAIERTRLLRPDMESLLVAGAGPIGLGVLAMAKLLFGTAFPVFITDTIPYRLALAQSLGGLPIPVTEGTVADGLKQHNRPRVDTAIDTSGKGAARQACLDALDKRGVLTCVGHGEGLTLQVSPDLIAPERAVLGSEYFCYHELPANLSLLQQHRTYLRQIITHEFGVADIQTAFNTFFQGNTGKVIIVQ